MIGEIGYFEGRIFVVSTSTVRVGILGEIAWTLKSVQHQSDK